MICFPPPLWYFLTRVSGTLKPLQRPRPDRPGRIRPDAGKRPRTTRGRARRKSQTRPTPPALPQGPSHFRVGAQTGRGRAAQGPYAAYLSLQQEKEIQKTEARRRTAVSRLPTPPPMGSRGSHECAAQTQNHGLTENRPRKSARSLTKEGVCQCFKSSSCLWVCSS
jgi:hypothetical protein